MIKADLYVVGLGIPELQAMTFEAWHAMSACKVLYVNDPSDQILQKTGAELRPIGDLGNARGDDARKKVIASVVAAAAKNGPAGLALYGHPMIYEPITVELAQAGKKKGLRTRVIAGISAFDEVLACLGLPLTRGFGARICDEEHFLATAPEPRATTVVYRVFYDRGTIARVAERCRKAYPQSHRVALVECRNWNREETIQWLTLAELPKEEGKHGMYTTLVIPPLA